MIQGLLVLAEQVASSPEVTYVGIGIYTAGVTTALGVIYRRMTATEDGRRTDAVESVKALATAQAVLKDTVKAMERMEDAFKDQCEEIRLLREDLRRRAG